MNTGKVVFILNAPPSSGKDVLADFIHNNLKGFSHHRFKTTLYDETAKYYAVEFSKTYTLCSHRDLKEIPCWEFGGISPREALKYVSEEIIKPTYGKDHFGQVEKARILSSLDNKFVVSDGGFKEEIKPLADAGIKVFILRIRREGCDFSNDSREYLYDIPDTEGVEFIDIINDGTLNQFLFDGLTTVITCLASLHRK